MKEIAKLLIEETGLFVVFGLVIICTAVADCTQKTAAAIYGQQAAE